MSTVESQQPLEPSLEVLTSERGRCVFYAYKNITVAVWTGQAEENAARATERAARAMVARHSAGRSFVAFVLDGLPGPTPEATRVFTEAMGSREGLAHVAYVLEGSGFWASGLRGMINNAHRESGAKARLLVATTIEDVAAWLAPRHEQATGVAVSEEELRSVLANARALGGLAGSAQAVWARRPGASARVASDPG